MNQRNGGHRPVPQAVATEVEAGPGGVTLWFFMLPQVEGGAGVRLPVTLTPYSAKRLARVLAARLNEVSSH